MRKERKPKWGRTVAINAAWTLLVLGVGAYSLWSFRGLDEIVPYTHRAAATLVGVIAVELTPRSWRRDFWTDVGLRALVIGAVCWSMFLLILGKP